MRMDSPKISVIVPVYKVEAYLRKCLDSIAGQTYRNLEIILVDDGSPDNCGAICDEYAARDGRFIVIHKENGGLSSARNAALRVATGDYLGFVDSDDWVEPEMFEVLLSGLTEAKADISVCGRYEEYKDKQKAYAWPDIQVMSREAALGELLKNDTLQNLVWDKLYRKELFKDIWFPEGKTFEDMAVMHLLFLRADKVVCLPNTMYHYLQRSGSIIDDISIENRLNHYRAAKDRYDLLAKDWPQYSPLMEAQCVASAIGLWTGYLRNPKSERRKYAPEMSEIAAFSSKHRKSVLLHSKLGLAGRLILPMIPYNTWWSFTLSYFIGNLYKFKHGRTL